MFKKVIKIILGTLFLPLCLSFDAPWVVAAPFSFKDYVRAYYKDLAH